MDSLFKIRGRVHPCYDLDPPVVAFDGRAVKEDHVKIIDCPPHIYLYQRTYGKDIYANTRTTQGSQTERLQQRLANKVFVKLKKEVLIGL